MINIYYYKLTISHFEMYEFPSTKIAERNNILCTRYIVFV